MRLEGMWQRAGRCTGSARLLFRVLTQDDLCPKYPCLMPGPLHLPARALCLSITKVIGVPVLPGLLAGSHTGQSAGPDSAPIPGVEGWADQAPARETLHLRTRIWVTCDLLISLVPALPRSGGWLAYSLGLAGRNRPAKP